MQTSANFTAFFGSARHINPSSGCGGIGKKDDSTKLNSASHHTACGCEALAMVQLYNPRSGFMIMVLGESLASRDAAGLGEPRSVGKRDRITYLVIFY